MVRNPDRRSLLWMLPGDRRKRVLDHAEERTSGIHALLRVLVVWVVTAVTLYVLSAFVPEIDIPGWRLPELAIVGPDHMHRHMRRWLADLGHERYRDGAP